MKKLDVYLYEKFKHFKPKIVYIYKIYNSVFLNAIQEKIKIW